jgi:hypothetical protein
MVHEPPQSTSLSLPSRRPFEQLVAPAVHAPLAHTPEAQSLPLLQAAPAGQLARQAPPQSRSDSVPSLMPLVQLDASTHMPSRHDCPVGQRTPRHATSTQPSLMQAKPGAHDPLEHEVAWHPPPRHTEPAGHDTPTQDLSMHAPEGQT